MKMSKQFRIVAAALLGGIVVASSACSVDGITPTSNDASLAPSAPSFYAAGSASEQTATMNVGIPDGQYHFSINPQVDQVITLGQSRVVLPAGSICAIGTSGYASSLWDNGCNPQKKAFTLKVTVAGAGTENAAVDFQPAMRFNPTKSVMMYLHVPQLDPATPYAWTIFYCPTPDGKPGRSLGTATMRQDPNCVDESLTDPSLKVVADYQNALLARRLKHFSAYQAFRGGYLGVE